MDRNLPVRADLGELAPEVRDETLHGELFARANTLGTVDEVTHVLGWLHCRARSNEGATGGTIAADRRSAKSPFEVFRPTCPWATADPSRRPRPLPAAVDRQRHRPSRRRKRHRCSRWPPPPRVGARDATCAREITAGIRIATSTRVAPASRAGVDDRRDATHPVVDTAGRVVRHAAR